MILFFLPAPSFAGLGEAQGNYGAYPVARAHGNRAAVQIHNTFNQREAKAPAFYLAGEKIVNLVKFVKDFAYVLLVNAYAVVGYGKDGRIMGMAGASDDSDTMWQVGIDVVPEFRNNGVATALVSIITDEILKKNIVPFYCTGWSNIASKNVALSSGYKPAWAALSWVDIN